jgi:hypothetical protein
MVQQFGPIAYAPNAAGDPIWYRGNQAFINNGVLFSLYFGSVLSEQTESDLMSKPTGAQLVDGAYTAYESLNKIPPVIRANYLLPRTRRLTGHLQLGIHFASLGSACTIRMYARDILLAEATINALDYSADPSGANLPLEIWYYINNVQTAAPFQMRCHSKYESASTDYSMLRMNESYFSGDYPFIDPRLDLPLRLTYVWNEANCYLFGDSFTVREG